MAVESQAFDLFQIESEIIDAMRTLANCNSGGHGGFSELVCRGRESVLPILNVFNFRKKVEALFMALPATCREYLGNEIWILICSSGIAGSLSVDHCHRQSDGSPAIPTVDTLKSPFSYCIHNNSSRHIDRENGA